jgi:dynamin GTPase
MLIGAVFLSPMLLDFYDHLTFPSLMSLCSHLSRLDRVRRDDDQKNRGSKKAQDAEQSLLSKATAPVSLNGSGGNLKAMKGEAAQAEKDSNKDVPSTLQIVGDNSAGYLLKKSAKKDEWSKRWFVLNERNNRVSQQNNFSSTL